MNPTPRQFFRKHHSEDAGHLAVLINEPWFQRVVMAVYAEIGTRNVEALSGAKEFVATLHSLTEDDPSSAVLPDHSELKTYVPGWKPDKE
jgi:hypothetical protein